MCHHFRLIATQREVFDAFRVTRVRMELPLKIGDFHPLSRIPIIRLNDYFEREVVAVEWGLLPSWLITSAGPKSRRTLQRGRLNACCETLAAIPTYSEAFQWRRCIIPATEFIEREHCFHTHGGQPFVFAGLWDRWQGRSKTIESCAIVTTSQNKAAQSLESWRMPLVLHDPWDIESWLNPGPSGIEDFPRIFTPRKSPGLEHYRAV